jgi:dipeptidyl aminopeptidase/acylaminoacyl peptidase
MYVELPRWSPDGKEIAFMGQKSPKDLWQVYLIPADGGDYRPVLPAPYPQGAPTWSADGTELAFGELLAGDMRPPHTPAGAPAIHVVNLRTHEATTIPGSNGLWTARWSPDGRHLAALTADSRALMVFDFRTQQWEKTAAAGQITDLNWSHDSEWIYFEDFLPPNGPAIFRVRVGDQHVGEPSELPPFDRLRAVSEVERREAGGLPYPVPEMVASLKREPPIYSAWLGLTPDDCPLVSNSVGTSEIYALEWEEQ